MNLICAIIVITLCVTNTTPEVRTTTPALILTPLVNQNKTAEARQQSIVDPSLFLNVKSHSGFLTVDENYGSNMFFWYFPFANRPANETEWIIWLQGGPGVTSLMGTFQEIGPFKYFKNNGTIKLRDYSWTENYSILFIDNPVGTGFSFTNSNNGFIRNLDECANHLYKTLQQFLKIFPELRIAPLYIAGGSYAGRYVPAFAKKIMDAQPVGENAVNLQGIILSSPILNRENIMNYTSIFYQWGLIDSQGVLAVKELQNAYSKAVLRGDNNDAYNKRDELLSHLEDISLQFNLYNLLQDVPDYDSFTEYVVRPSVKQALHVGDIRFAFSNNSVYSNLKYDTLFQVRPKIEALLEKYKVLIFCGQLDLMVPCIPNMQARRDHWHWSGRNAFLHADRIPWWFNNTVVGYVKSGGKFTEALIKGAGHLAPMERPAEVHQLITHFIEGKHLPIPPTYSFRPEFTPEYNTVEENTTVSPNNIGLISSVIVNVLLVICIISGVVYFFKWRRRYETYFYCGTNDAIPDGVLSLA